MISLVDQHAEARRELALRKKLYPKWVTLLLDSGVVAFEDGVY